MSFFTIVIIIAACFLILCLVAVGILMQRYNASANFPPVKNPCPDGWTVNGEKCLITDNNNVGFIKNNVSNFVTNTPGLTTTNPSVPKDARITNPLDGYSSVDFNDITWNKGGSSICSQQKWANQFGITWDGISNSNGC